MTDEPRRRSADSMLDVLSERMNTFAEGQRSQTTQLNRIVETLADLKLTTAKGLSDMTARADTNQAANTASAKQADHDKGASIARDQQQVTMLHDEEASRIGGDKNNVVLIEKLIAKVETLTLMVGEIKSNDRLYARIAGILVVILTGYITGHLLRMFP